MKKPTRTPVPPPKTPIAPLDGEQLARVAGGYARPSSDNDETR